MKIKTDQRIQSLNVKVGSCDAGLLSKMAQFDFSYHADASTVSQYAGINYYAC